MSAPLFSGRLVLRVILIALLSAMPAAAQTAPLSLTLEDAVRRAIDNNPELAIVRLETEVDTARIDQTRTAFTPVFSTMLGRSSAVTPPANFLLGERGVDVDDWFSSTGVRQRLPWGSGTWSVSWDTSRTATTQPVDELRSHAAIGIRDRVLAAVAPRSRRGFGTLSIRDCQAKPRQLGPAVSRGDRPDRGRGEAGLLDPEGGAGERRRAAAIARSGARARA